MNVAEQEAVARWRTEVRTALWYEYHRNGEFDVSDNDVYTLIFVTRKVTPPPVIEGSRRGLARSAIFTGVENRHYCSFYENTGKKILSIDPSAKRRRIVVFTYIPGLDYRDLGLNGMLSNMLDPENSPKDPSLDL